MKGNHLSWFDVKTLPDTNTFLFAYVSVAGAHSYWYRPLIPPRHGLLRSARPTRPDRLVSHFPSCRMAPVEFPVDALFFGKGAAAVYTRLIG